MREPILRLLAVLALSICFNYLFWSEKMGLNTLFFGLLSLISLAWAFPESHASRSFWATAAGTLLTAAMVVWHNSAAAKIAFWVSAMCAAGFAQAGTLRFILYALLQYLQSLVYMPRHFLQSLVGMNHSTQKSVSTLRRNLGLVSLPLLIVAVFYGLYYAANAKFAAFSDRFWAEIGALVSFDISIPRLFFWLLGLFVCGGALWPHASALPAADDAAPDRLLRQKVPRSAYAPVFPTLGLRREYRQSVLLLWMLNALLLFVNLTDARYVWFGVDEETQKDLKGYVHEGTYFLIASILLAMGVLFFAFRKNLNFFPKNQPLKTAAGIWLVQNAVLAFSVAVRNLHYIDFHGLAYKRLGVFLFLSLVFFGLYTLWVKIRDTHSNWWLWRHNAWAFYTLLVLNACVNWDVFITQYNLSGKAKNTVDLHQMIYDLSNKNLFLLEASKERLPQLNAYPPIVEEAIEQGIAAKRSSFDSEQARLSWKSWNVADRRNK